MILITAATGQYGRLVVDALLQTVAPKEVAVAVRHPEKARDWRTRGVSVRQADYDDLSSLHAAFDGVVVHKVYSTWSVAHHFELAARMVLVDFLDSHEEGVGSHVSVDHHAPCPVGNRVRVEARLVEVTHGRHIKVVCECRAFWGERLLATGKQVQVVMEKEHLKRYLERS